MFKSSLNDRWFRYWEITRKELSEAEKQTDINITQLKKLYRYGYYLVTTLLTISIPLFTGKLTKISKLSDQEFEHFLNKLYLNKTPIIRSLGVLYLYPLLSATFDTSPPEEYREKATHILDKDINQEAIPDNEIVDVVVVGSGAGGAPAGWYLASQCLKVVMFEKGDLVKPRRIGEIFMQNYVQHGLMGSFFKNATLVSAGANVGGSTPINMGTFLRPDAELLQEWDKKYGTNFSSVEFSNLFEKVEKISHVRESLDSELNTSSKMFYEYSQRDKSFIASKIAHSFRDTDENLYKKVQYPYLAQYSVDRSFIPNAIDNGMRFYRNTEVTSIKESEDFVDVTYINDGRSGSVRCKRVILAGGALFTPKLIRDSQLGTKWQEAGKELKLHPAASVYAHFDNFEYKDGVPQDVLFKKADLPDITFEGIRIPKEMALIYFLVSSKNFKFWIENYPSAASFGFLVKDKSVGSLSYIGDKIFVDYDICKEDMDSIVEASFYLAELFFKLGAKRVLLPFSTESSEIGSSEQLMRVDKNQFKKANLLNSAAFHPSGTAGLGRVVDKEFKLIGTEKIYLSDASVIPDAPGVNPQLFIMANSLSIGKKILERDLQH